MQMLSVQIQDNYVQNFINFVNNSDSNIIINKDDNLVYDRYFYDRKKDLEQLIEDTENGKVELLSQEQYDDEMEIFFKDLKANEDI
jgi:hypothetical protein